MNQDEQQPSEKGDEKFPIVNVPRGELGLEFEADWRLMSIGEGRAFVGKTDPASGKPMTKSLSVERFKEYNPDFDVEKYL